MIQASKEETIPDKGMSTKWLMGLTLIGVIFICIAFFVFRVVFGSSLEKTVDQQEFQYEKHPVMGSKNAPVKMVEFADFKCPSCKKFNETVLKQIKSDFVDKGIVQIYFVNLPFIGPDSQTAALAGESVFNQNPQEYWKFEEAVYHHQEDEHTNWATPETLVQIAKQADIKVDYDKLKKDMEEKTFLQQLAIDQEIAKKIKVNGTPTIYINGKEISEKDTFDYGWIKKTIENSK